MERRNTRTIVAASLILVAAGLMVLNFGGFLAPIEGIVLRPLTSVQTWIALRFSAVRDVITSPSDVASLREQINFLESENARLQQEIISLREQAAEAEILSALLNYARAQPESRYIAANVIGRDISPFLRSVLINRGSDHGIAAGMPVVTARGLAGRVVEVFATSSRVQLITDPGTAVNVQFQDSRTEGILTAQLNGDLIVDLIDLNAEIEEGELVLTSGLGGNYPDKIPVGEVVNIRRRDFDLFQQATIQSAVDLDELDIVLVITNFRPFELE
jgi:rod shape-determining protein MreC